VLHRLDVLSKKAEELGQISAAVRCEELIGKQRGMFVDRTISQWELDPRSMTKDQLEVLADYYLRCQLQTDDPQVPAEARREIEARVTVETTAEVVRT
jgi:hypothetical protein